MTGYGGRDRYQDDRRSYDRGTFIFFYRFYSILLIFTQTHFQTTVVIIVVMVSVEAATITIKEMTVEVTKGVHQFGILAMMPY